MAETFTWRPSIDPTGVETFRVRSAQFGSGYKQVAADGINNGSQSWPLTFKGLESRIEEIVAFLRAHKGYIPFSWTPPLSAPALFTCTSWNINPHGARYYTVTATFEQYFGVT
jgi:phage-related protein